MIKAIMYHYVRQRDKALPYFTFLHFNDFCKQLDYFTEHYNIIHPNLLRQSIQQGIPGDGMVLTFDDGLKDHYRYVFPELQKRGLAAIFYVSTGIFDSSRILGVHRLHLLLGKVGGTVVYNYLMQLVSNDMLSHSHVDEFRAHTYNNQLADEHTQMVKRMMNYYISYEHRLPVLDKIMAHFFDDEEALLKSYYMSPAEIKEMHDAGMIIGSHTVSHPVMSKLSPAEQVAEITSSVQQLEHITGGLYHRTFCYPHGGFHTFTSDTEAILTSQNFCYSFNVEDRDICANDLKNRPQALPRFNCNLFPHGKIYLNHN